MNLRSVARTTARGKIQGYGNGLKRRHFNADRNRTPQTEMFIVSTLCMTDKGVLTKRNFSQFYTEQDHVGQGFQV
jgi:hypothetical protein